MQMYNAKYIKRNGNSKITKKNSNNKLETNFRKDILMITRVNQCGLS